jgi:hypothetical protein
MSYFPFRHVAGTTMNFRVGAPGFSSSEGWTLRYYLTARFTSPAQAQIIFDAAPNADGTYQVQQSPVQTSTWTPGAYGWQRVVIKGDEKHALTGSNEQGECEVRPNPASLAQGYDTRTHARRMLEAIEAILEDRASSSQREMVAYAIGTRSMTFDSEDTRAELVKLHSQYQWAVYDEDAKARLAAGLPNPRRIGIRFNR